MGPLGLCCCTGSLQRQGAGLISGVGGSLAVVCRLRCPGTCGVSSDRGSNLCPLLWQVGSSPLDHQGHP